MRVSGELAAVKLETSRRSASSLRRPAVRPSSPTESAFAIRSLTASASRSAAAWRTTGRSAFGASSSRSSVKSEKTLR
jgi:hypothetical protein